jgi:hypothetical protein
VASQYPTHQGRAERKSAAQYWVVAQQVSAMGFFGLKCLSGLDLAPPRLFDGRQG